EATTDEDNAVTVHVLDNDSDVDGDSLVVSAVTQPAHGSVVINLDNTITYTPAPNFNGDDEFTYTAADGHGGDDSDGVTIHVTPVNDPPTVTVTGGACLSDITAKARVDLTVSDPETAAAALVLTASSSNTVLVPNSGLALGGSGANRTLTV